MSLLPPWLYDIVLISAVNPIFTKWPRNSSFHLLLHTPGSHRHCASQRRKRLCDTQHLNPEFERETRTESTTGQGNEVRSETRARTRSLTSKSTSQSETRQPHHLPRNGFPKHKNRNSNKLACNPPKSFFHSLPLLLWTSPHLLTFFIRPQPTAKKVLFIHCI